MAETNMPYGDDFAFCRSYLTNGEYILWQGKPEKKSVFSAYDIFLIPFSILWCGFAFFWEISVIQNGVYMFAIFGIPFVCLGVYFVFGRFFLASYLRKNTAYVITNKKIIRKRGKKIDMLGAINIPPMYVDVRKNGNGNIRFGQEMYFSRGWNNTNTMNMFGYSNMFMLENIPDVLKVQQIINNMEK